MEYKLTFKRYDEALRQNKLLGLKCRDCGAVTIPPKMVCRQCASSEIEVVELGGRGKIQTFTVVNVPPEGRESEVPYIIAMVELDEGPWTMGNLDNVDPATATMALIGKRVTMKHKVFPGDKYSAGDSARPLFSLEA
ncbi:MAG: Zn-ribbon domain-containing OB-fold protein [Chloroflexi bacterium]|nr:Zn-ribbon domain-containing OB-fold protein [Chloroflexota bacterium]